MARRERSSPAEDLLDIMSMLPWWISLLIGLVSYFVLHSFAEAPLIQQAPTSAVELANSVGPMMRRTMCQYFQYIIPVISVFAALISAFKRRH